MPSTPLGQKAVLLKANHANSVILRTLDTKTVAVLSGAKATVLASKTTPSTDTVPLPDEPGLHPSPSLLIHGLPQAIGLLADLEVVLWGNFDADPEVPDTEAEIQEQATTSAHDLQDETRGLGHLHGEGEDRGRHPAAILYAHPDLGLLHQP